MSPLLKENKRKKIGLCHCHSIMPVVSYLRLQYNGHRVHGFVILNFRFWILKFELFLVLSDLYTRPAYFAAGPAQLGCGVPITSNWINNFFLNSILLLFYFSFIFFLFYFSFLSFILFLFFLYYFSFVFSSLFFNLQFDFSKCEAPLTAGPWAIAHFAHRVSRHSSYKSGKVIVCEIF